MYHVRLIAPVLSCVYGKIRAEEEEKKAFGKMNEHQKQNKKNCIIFLLINFSFIFEQMK